MSSVQATEATMRFRARVSVFPRPEILDPQGKAITEGLRRIGFSDVGEVRAGKSFEIELEAADEDAARERLNEMCQRLLANPIMEDYSLELVAEEAS